MRSFLDGGPFVWLLLGLSVTALTVVLERLWSLRRDRILPRPLMDALADGDVARLRGACQAQPSPMARLILSILDHLPWPKAENVAALEVRARQEIANLERGLVILEIIVGIAPLLGLVGTIYGAFIAKGMSIALYKTVLGLLVAMPTLAAWSLFNKRVELLGLELESVCDALMRRHYLRERGVGAEGVRP